MTAHPEGPAAGAGPGEYLALSDSLKQLPGVQFETHGHPAVILDRATPSSTLVWGWWAEAAPPVPCLLWASPRGWSATVVEPGAFDSEGYERAFWSHRITLLDLALANAIGPFPTLDRLERTIAVDDSFGAGAWAVQLTSAVLWGVRQLREARSGSRGRASSERRPTPPATAARCVVDAELALHALVPTLAKAPGSPETAGVEALLGAVRKAALRKVDAGTPRADRAVGIRAGR
jgi:hypothetical protein